MDTPGFQIGPYSVGEPLGRGGMGEVYLAHDPRLGRHLALKLLPPHVNGDAEAVDRFMREARAASALNHPNVITIYEIGEAESRRFIAMELVQGTTLRPLIGASPPVDAVARLGMQVARALAVAHAAGIVHRDIKPENVMVRPDGYVKVLDFGVARLLASAAGRGQTTLAGTTLVGHAVGTLRYMSPEQASGEAVTGATDIFSLGILLGELLTGHHPFSGARDPVSDLALLSAILTGAPAPPSTLNPSIGSDLDALLVRMLDRHPERRPAAIEVERRLAELAASPAARPEGGVQAARPERHSVGREAERRILREVLDAADAGRGMVVSIAGEPGIGKTTLVEEFVAELSSATRPYRIARGRCSERLAGSEAYLPIFEALDDLLRGPDGPAMVALMKRLAPTWYLQLEPAVVDDSSESRALARVQANSPERLTRELGAFFDELTRHTPMVLLLDDLHWADASTVDILAYVGTRLATLRLVVLVTVRPAELLLARHPFAQLRLDLQARGLCREIALDFLTSPEVEQYLALQFPGHAFPPELATLVHAKTEGSPLFMADLLRDLRARGVIAEDGRWHLAQSVPDLALGLPESIRGMIQRKIEQLDDDERRLLAAASVQGHEFDSALVAELTGSDPADVEERLERLEHVYGFVRRAHEEELPDRTLSVRYRFVHVLYQNALYASLTPTRRVSLSARAADTLLRHHGDRRGEIAAELAALFEAARDTPRAVEHLSLAARNAARVFANQEVVVLVRRALQLLAALPETPARDEQELHIQTTYASALGALHGMAAPDVGEAVARADALWRRLGARPDLFPVLTGLWGYEIIAGRLDAALGLGEELLHIAEGQNERALLVAAHNCLALTLHHVGDHARALDHMEQGLASYGLDLSDRFVSIPIEPGVSLASESARVLWVLGYPDRALGRSEEALELGHAVPHPEARAFALLFAAFLHHFLGDVARTLDHTETVLALARERDIATSLAWGMVLHGWALARQGRIEEGLAEIRTSLAAQRAAGSLIARPQFLAMLADACRHAGGAADALAAAEEGLACSAATGDRYWDSELERLRGEVLADMPGREAEADASFRRSLADAEAHGAKSLELRAATSAARFWNARGAREQAGDVLARVYGWFTEGLDTADLVAARGVLDSLGRSGSAG